MVELVAEEGSSAAEMVGVARKQGESELRVKVRASLAASLLPRLLAEGFLMHHATPEYVMVSIWLGEGPSEIQPDLQQRLNYGDDVERLVDQNLSVLPGGCVMTGSSIFREWEDAAEHLAPVPVVNNAFGGSCTWEVLFNADLLVLRHSPRLVLYYCGSNDVNFYWTRRPDLSDEAAAASIAGHVSRFKELVLRFLPDSLVVFCSVIRAPQKREKWHVIDDANARIQAMCEASPSCSFVDLHSVLEDPPCSRKPIASLYREDDLHYKRESYRYFQSALRPVVTRAWGQVEGSRQDPQRKRARVE